MRSNRLLGAQLVEQNLIKLDDLEGANEKLLDLIGSGTARQRTVLGILAYDLNAVKEEEILIHQRDTDGTGMVDLEHYEVNEELKEDLTFIATAYYLSPAVRKFWEERYDGRVLWYGTTLEGIAEYLEKLQGGADAASDGTAPTATDPAPNPNA